MGAVQETTALLQWTLTVWKPRKVSAQQVTSLCIRIPCGHGWDECGISIRRHGPIELWRFMRLSGWVPSRGPVRKARRGFSTVF